MLDLSPPPAAAPLRRAWHHLRSAVAGADRALNGALDRLRTSPRHARLRRRTGRALAALQRLALLAALLLLAVSLGRVAGALLGVQP
jgi:hypothetical protein